MRGCTGTEIVLDANEKRMLNLHNLHNQMRASKGLRTLCVHPALQKAAEAHSQDMIDKDCFSHTSKDGRSPGTRLKQAGYNRRTYGENIAWGSGTLGAPTTSSRTGEQRRPPPQHPQQQLPRGRHRRRHRHLQELLERHHVDRRLRRPLGSGPRR